MAAVNNSLVEHFTFDRGRLTGRVAGVALTNNNSVTFPTGRIGHAADCERGSTQFLSCASNATVQTGDINFAFSAWVKPESLPASGSQFMIIAKDSNVAASRDYFMDLRNTAGSCHFRIFIANAAGSFAFAEQTATTISTGRWYHLLAQHNADANTVAIYVDGALAGSNTTAGLVPNASAAAFRIGARVFSGFEDYFDGQIDDVRIYKNRIFAANEVVQLTKWRGMRRNPIHNPMPNPIYNPAHYF